MARHRLRRLGGVRVAQRRWIRSARVAALRCGLRLLAGYPADRYARELAARADRHGWARHARLGCGPTALRCRGASLRAGCACKADRARDARLAQSGIAVL